MQLVFIEYTKKHRRGVIENVTTSFSANKIPNMTRQVKFAQFFMDNLEVIRQTNSSRFMLVDNRICTKLIDSGTCQKLQELQELQADQVLLNRSYLYTLTPTEYMIIKFKNQSYIRFPPEYAVIRNGPDYKTGKIKHNYEDYTYGTCFDTRTYSCLRYKQRLKADSEEMMTMIKELTGKNKVIP